MSENLRIDHVMYGTADMDRTASELLEAHGLGSVVGGKHEGRGTGNRIVPLGSAYLELTGVVDPVEAAGHPFGRWLSQQVAEGDHFLVWCVGTDDVDSVATRLGLEVDAWTRTTPDGTELSWRLAGLEVSNEHPEIPYFIQWEIPPELHPSRSSADHRVQPEGFRSLQLAGDEARVEEWLAGAALPIAFTPNGAGVVGATVATERGGIVLP
ncbi:MAG: hypothetical protein QOG04_1121 [Actinomycetota bacterium]|jgi:hypothetical protein|nr:hypothetical protein [Actinomycetota bacterium]